MSWQDMEQSILHQIDNDIYYGSNEPDPDLECPRFEYTFFIFTKYNINSNIEWKLPELLDRWQYVGGSWIGDWKENQFSGEGPIENLYRNYNMVKQCLENLKNMGILLDYRMRYRYPVYVSD